jgi:hypothetical protein
MKRFIGPLALLVFMAAPSIGHTQVKFPNDESGRYGGTPLGAWLGGTNSLPIGNGNAHEAIAHALVMPAVRPILDEYTRRGYLRLSDGDVAFLEPNFTVVAITFQKPGIPPTQRTPVVLVASRKEGNYYVTQAYGGIVGGDDPDGPMHVYDEWPDRAVVVAGRITGGSGRGVIRTNAGGTTPGEFAGFVTAYDPGNFGNLLSATWDYTLYDETGYGAHVWSQYAQVVGASTLFGGLNGFRAPPETWPVSVTWGAVAGFGLANTTFWATHEPGF